MFRNFANTFLSCNSSCFFALDLEFIPEFNLHTNIRRKMDTKKIKQKNGYAKV